MANPNDPKYKSCDDERLSQIIFVEGCLKSFNEEYWHPEIRKYEDFRHVECLKNLRDGTRHHLKGAFEDMEYSEGDKNMWYNSYDCTHHQKAEDMYNMFVEEVNAHVKKNLLPKLEAVQDDSLLQALALHWNTHKSTIQTFSELFQHLTLWIEDVPEDEVPKDGIKMIGLKEFKKEIVLQNEIKERLTTILKETTDKHREGDKVNCDEIKTLCGMLVEMECYEEVFENNFLEQAKEFYGIVASKNIVDMSSHEYVVEVETLIANEKARTASYGNEKTTDKTLSVLKKVLISDQLQAIAHREGCGGVPRMFEDNLEDQLKNVYVTFKRVKGGHKILRDCFANYEIEAAKKVVAETAKKSSAEMQVNRLIQLKNTCNRLVSNSFFNNSEYQCDVESSFSKVVQTNKNVSENLSVFIDMKKMKSITGEQEQKEMERIENHFITIYKAMTNNKDDFKAAFKKLLCKRIVKVKSPYLAYDKRIVGLMKDLGAPADTKEVDNIIKDFEASKVLNKNYIKDSSNDVYFNCRVVSSREWTPTKKLDASLIPSVVSDGFERFQQFYRKADSTNKIKTLTVLNKNFVAEVSLNLPAKSYSLHLCSYYQIAVVELFNQRSQFTFEELLNETNLSAEDLTEVLRSLTYKKHQILLKSPSGKTFSPTDIFTVNEGLDQESDKINVQMVPKAKY